jgi:ADP-ribosyltransferase exoenzyme
VPILAVDPTALSAAGSAVVAAGDGLDAAMTVLTAGFGANTGLDVAGEVFGLSYQSTAESLLKAAAAVINACRRNGVMVQVDASNWSKAEAASTLGGGASVLQAPAEPARIGPPGPPGTLGPGEPPPLLWALVQSFVDDVWPDGDVAGLHAAAGCWRTFSSAVSGMQGALNGSRTLVGTQQIPEGDKINQVLSQIGGAMAKLGGQCGKMATTLDDFANQVAQAQNDIRNLLHRLESLTDVWHDVVSILDGDALEEIKKIAHDINAVLHDLGRQARAFEQGIKLLMQVADGLVVDMEKFMRGQFTHFLGDAVGNQVATVFDTFVNANEGVVNEAAQTVLGLADLSTPWLLLDPKGAEATWKGMAQSQFKASLLNEILHPREGAEANLQMWQSLLHLDDWSTARPGLGFGENLFDGATFFLPGIGEAGAGAEAGSAAARGAEEAAEAAEGAGAAGRAWELGATCGAPGDIGKTTTGLTKDLENLKLDLPKADPLPGGRPVGAPPGKPIEAPVEPVPRPVESAPSGARPPESPTTPGGPPAPGRPIGPVAPHDPVPAIEPPSSGGPPEEGPHDPVPARAGSPHEPASVPTAPVEQLPSNKLEPAELTQPRLPLSSVATPAEPAPVPAQPVSAQTPTTPPVQAPEFGPPGGHPPDPPDLHGSGPYGLEEGKLPHGQPSEPALHGPGDGGADDGGLADGHADPNAHVPFNSDDLAALADYTGSGYQDLNHGLRNFSMDASQLARVDAVNAALEKLPVYEGPVIRGSDIPAEMLELYRPGESITEHGFLSTTTDLTVARSPAFAGNVEFRILSKSGRDISPYSMFPAEQEVLFPSGTEFYVVDKVVNPLTGRTVIRMIEY